MSLLADLARGIVESIRETLPGDQDEARCWLGGFLMALGVQVVWFSALTFGSISGMETR